MPDHPNERAGRRKPANTDNNKGQKTGENYLLVIGIDQYEHFPRLYNAVKDAKDFIGLMTSRYQFEEGRVRSLFDKEATLDNIFTQLEMLRRLIQPNDSLLVYFSGHGEYDEDLDEGSWIPYDGEGGQSWSFLDFSRIVKYIKAIKTLHTFIIADSCYSGSLFSDRSIHKEPLPRDFFIPSRYILTAGRNEVVSDGKPGDNSPFADSLLWHLENDPGPHISVTELCERVKKDVSSNVKQIPRYGSVHGIGDRGGMFYFFEKGFAPKAPERKEPLRSEGTNRSGTNEESEPEYSPTEVVIRSFWDFKAALKKSVQLREFEDTFDLIDKFLKPDSKVYNDWIFQQGRYNGIQRQHKKGVIDHDFAQRTYNQITDALFYEINRLKQEFTILPEEKKPDINILSTIGTDPFWEKIQRLDLESLQRQATTWKEKITYLEEEEPLITDSSQKFALKKRLEEARKKYDAIIKTIKEKE